MKKNVMMRLASFLLVAVLISTSAISGTYAKYVTADDAVDNARVAKWGVVLGVDGTLFSTTYLQKAEGNVPGTGAGVTVESSNSDKLVAPGTQNDTGITVVLNGNPEVDVAVNFTFEVVDNKEIKLVAGDYTDYTKPSGYETDGTPKYDNKFNVATDYYPVVFTLKKDGTQVAQGNVAAIQTYLSTLNTTYEANSDLAGAAGKYQLTWAWDFDDNGAGTYDKADTYLGNETSLQEISVKFSVSATQVD